MKNPFALALSASIGFVLLVVAWLWTIPNAPPSTLAATHAQAKTQSVPIDCDAGRRYLSTLANSAQANETNNQLQTLGCAIPARQPSFLERYAAASPATAKVVRFIPLARQASTKPAQLDIGQESAPNNLADEEEDAHLDELTADLQGKERFDSAFEVFQTGAVHQ